MIKLIYLILLINNIHNSASDNYLNIIMFLINRIIGGKSNDISDEELINFLNNKLSSDKNKIK
jgi:hypothetical protein